MSHLLYLLNRNAVSADRFNRSTAAGDYFRTIILERRGGNHKELAMAIRPVISVVDDDESVRESLPDLLREFGFAVQTFSSGEEFLASEFVGQTNSLILDVAMPGMTGPELQRTLALRGKRIPIVFITARRDETVRRNLIEQGAVACLFKPFSDTALLEALTAALQIH